MRDLEVFFSHVRCLCPEGGSLVLAESSWSAEGREFVSSRALPVEEHPLPGEFDAAPSFLMTEENLSLLTAMASRHASPELAIHLAVHSDTAAVLEWYDVPDDPITVSAKVPERHVAEFAASCGVGFHWRAGESEAALP